MKLRILSTLAIGSVILASCGGHEKEETAEEAVSETVAAPVNYTINPMESTISWKGEVAGVYGHSGNVNFKNGTFTTEGENVIAGEFVVDMTSIVPTDSASFTEEEGHRITDLQKHLGAEDFFNVAQFPTASFVITRSEDGIIVGDLTIRGKTHEEKIELEPLQEMNGNLTVKGKMVFNRQKYDVAWVHFMKDMVLSDDITLNFTVVATK